MKFPNSKQISSLAALGAAAATVIGIQHLAAQSGDAVLHGYYLTEPLSGPAGNFGPGLQTQSGTAAAATTIPMSTYSFAATKNARTYAGTIVGTSPFTAPASANIPVVVVPLKITIGSTVFDPTAANTCDGNISTVNRFNQSPLTQVTPLSFNGVGVGTVQYPNGFRRAEFWSQIGGSAAYQNTLTYTTAATASATMAGSLYSSGCTQLGIVGYNAMSSLLNTQLAALKASGVGGPTKFVMFLVKNVVQSTANPPSLTGCCILGFHGASGSPIQTYGVMDWDTTGDFGTASKDGAISSHEIGEWMDDPLGTNPTPAWGNIGQVSGCQTNWEVGDPLSGTSMPAITLSGYAYHMQELGFFSWYFNKAGVASLGTGGKFSGNGTFKGASKACPPGGTN